MDTNFWSLSPPPRITRMELAAKLTRRGVSYHASAFKKRLEVLFGRKLRDLIIYDKLKTPELRTFCFSRRIAMDLPASGRGRTSVIRLLEEADERATLDRFLDLPPEMRLKIYELYFNSYDMSTLTPIAPICQVNRLIRKESLPVLLNHPILLHIRPGFHWQTNKQTLKPAMYYRSTDEPHSIFGMPFPLFQHIRQITIVPRFWYTAASKTSWTVKLDAKTTARRIVASPINLKELGYRGSEKSTLGVRGASETDQAAEISEFERALGVFVKEICGRGGKNFIRSDFERILRLLDRAWEVGRQSQASV